MKRIRSYQSFRESRPIKEEFIGKIFRGITGADKKDINAGVEKLQSIYNVLSDSEKLEEKPMIVVDDWPQIVPITAAEVETIERYLGQLLDAFLRLSR